MHALLVNAGSSSLKVSVRELETTDVVASVALDWAGRETRAKSKIGTRAREWITHERGAGEAFSAAFQELQKELTRTLKVQGVAHRVVHGGDLDKSLLITPPIFAKIEEASQLAPLHNPPSLAAIAAAQKQFGTIPHVAVFDTAFHRTMRPEAERYPIPHQWANDWHIKRYGFHGLSHAYCAKRVAEFLNHPSQELRIIVCHLGHGCSASAIKAGRCVDTTMGFTPLDGLMMATRSGSLDPGIILHVQQRYGLTPAQVQEALLQDSGLRGVSETSADMREVIAAMERGHAPSRLAFDLFCYRVQQAIAALHVPLAGADVLVFTGGIGENSAKVRAHICAGLEFLGFQLNEARNNAANIDSEISIGESAKHICVISTQEDLVLLEELKPLLDHKP